MNPKSVAIIVVVAIVVAAVSYGTYLMDSDEKLEIRDYLVEGDWVEYHDEYMDETERITVLDVVNIDNYEVSFSGELTTLASFDYMFFVVDADDGLEYLRSEKVDTFLGEIECDVYAFTVSDPGVEFYAEPDTRLVIIQQGSDIDGNVYRNVMTGTSIFDEADAPMAEIAFGIPVAGSTYTHYDKRSYVSGDQLYFEGSAITVTVESVNEDGTLNFVGGGDPATVEEFVSWLKMTDEEIANSTLEGTKVISTQWGLIECDLYHMPHVDTEGNYIGDRWFLVEPDTGLMLKTWLEMDEIIVDGEVWEDYYSEFTLIDCNVILVAD